MFITREEYQAAANLGASELANRPALMRGSGVPAFQAALYTEYEDEGTQPSTRYRKTGPNANDWTDISITRMLSASAARNATLILVASKSEAKANFTVSIPAAIQENITVVVVGYGNSAKLVNIIGGSVGQVVLLLRGEDTAMKVRRTDELQLSSTAFTMNDPAKMSNIILERTAPDQWTELARAKI